MFISWDGQEESNRKDACLTPMKYLTGYLEKQGDVPVSFMENAQCGCYCFSLLQHPHCAFFSIKQVARVIDIQPLCRCSMSCNFEKRSIPLSFFSC